MTRPTPRYQPGDRIGGRYKVHKALMGGMGEVYLCLDLEEKYPYALKTFQQRYQSSTLRKAFEHEVATWVALEKHSNIVRCFGMRILDNQPFMILEWIAGEEGKGTDLRGWLRSGPLELQTALNFTIDIVRGLIHAQEKQPGIVHRDLKPENILIAQGGQAKVSDFGLAQVLERAKLESVEFKAMTEGRQSLMPKNGIAGTPPYMAPEQWRGEILDERTDIYALGCVLYEMLTGQRPFQVDFSPTIPQRFQHWLSLMQYSHENNPSPVLPTTLPDELNVLLGACLAKIPTERPSNMAALLRQVEIIYREQFNRSPRAAHPPTAFTSIDYTNRGATYDNLKQYELALADYERAIRLDPSNRVAYNNRGSVYQELHQYEMALTDFNQTVDLGPQDAKVYNNRGNVHVNLGDYDHALKDLNRAIDLNPDIAHFYVTRGRIYQLIGDTLVNDDSRIQQHYRTSLTDCEKAIELDPTEAQAFVQRGVAYDRLNDLKNALVDFERALKIDPVNIGIYINRGAIYDKLARHEDALVDYNHAIELASFGEFDQQSQRLAYSNRAFTYIKMKAYESAISDFEYVLEIAPFDSQTHLNLGNLYAQQGRLWKALPYFEKAEQLGNLKGAQFVARTRSLLSCSDDSLSKIFQDAFEAFEQVSSIKEMKHFLTSHPLVMDIDFSEEIKQTLKSGIPSKKLDLHFEWMNQLITSQTEEEQNQ